MKQRKKSDTAPVCTHPPERLYAWYANDPSGAILCVCCCKCGAVLRGGVSLGAETQPEASTAA